MMRVPLCCFSNSRARCSELPLPAEPERIVSGCALAATRHAGIPECVRDGETGYLVEENDAEALADRIGKMIADSEATLEMGRKGRALALADFNLAHQSRKLQDHLLRVAREAGTLPKNQA